MVHGRWRRQSISVTGSEGGGGGNDRDARRWLGGPILGGGERGNLPWNVLHGGGRLAEGERRGGHRLVVVATGSGLGEKSGAQAVLTVALAAQSRGWRCRATVVRPWTPVASDTLPGATALLTRWSRPVLEEGVAPAA
jgi:hypothetical protein